MIGAVMLLEPRKKLFNFATDLDKGGESMSLCKIRVSEFCMAWPA